MLTELDTSQIIRSYIGVELPGVDGTVSTSDDAATSNRDFTSELDLSSSTDDDDDDDVDSISLHVCRDEACQTGSDENPEPRPSFGCFHNRPSKPTRVLIPANEELSVWRTLLHNDEDPDRTPGCSTGLKLSAEGGHPAASYSWLVAKGAGIGGSSSAGQSTRRLARSRSESSLGALSENAAATWKGHVTSTPRIEVPSRGSETGTIDCGMGERTGDETAGSGATVTVPSDISSSKLVAGSSSGVTGREEMAVSGAGLSIPSDTSLELELVADGTCEATKCKVPRSSLRPREEFAVSGAAMMGPSVHSSYFDKELELVADSSSVTVPVATTCGDRTPSEEMASCGATRAGLSTTGQPLKLVPSRCAEKELEQVASVTSASDAVAAKCVVGSSREDVANSAALASGPSTPNRPSESEFVVGATSVTDIAVAIESDAAVATGPVAVATVVTVTGAESEPGDKVRSSESVHAPGVVCVDHQVCGFLVEFVAHL